MPYFTHPSYDEHMLQLDELLFTNTHIACFPTETHAVLYTIPQDIEILMLWLIHLAIAHTEW